jgi:hypothetical protein
MFCELPCFYKIRGYCWFNYSNAYVHGNVMIIELYILMFILSLV